MAWIASFLLILYFRNVSRVFARPERSPLKDYKFNYIGKSALGDYLFLCPYLFHYSPSWRPGVNHWEIPPSRLYSRRTCSHVFKHCDAERSPWFSAGSCKRHWHCKSEALDLCHIAKIACLNLAWLVDHFGCHFCPLQNRWRKGKAISAGQPNSSLIGCGSSVMLFEPGLSSLSFTKCFLIQPDKAADR